MKLDNFIEGLKTLRPYYKEGHRYHIGAEQGQFYAYETDIPLSPEDVVKMLNLNWFQPSGGIDVDGGKYDPDKGWSAFI